MIGIFLLKARTDARSPRHVGRRTLLAAIAASAWTGSLQAQGVTTTAIRGRVVAADGSSVDGAHVRTLNTATGYVIESLVARGRFLVQGLEVGGPYVVTVTRLGFQPEQSERIFLKLGEPLELRFVMQPQAIMIKDVTVVAAAGFPRITAHGGTATTIDDSLVQRLPTFDRHVYDFVRLVPQVSTKIGFERSGLSAAGANFRFNNFLINGADERFVNSNLPAAFSAGKSIPLDAVKEYQVLIAPYDVRYGDFAGALVNTVTKSGTNEISGSTFALWRSDDLARGRDPASSSYDRLQYGFALGGPIIRNRVHFFVAPEFQRHTTPVSGPYVGQPSNATPALPVSAADIARLDAAMRQYELVGGSGGRAETGNPLRNLYARLDATIPRWRSRATAFVTYAGANEEEFSRSTAPDTFSLSSQKVTAATSLTITSLQLHTALSETSGAYNELVVSHSADEGDFRPDVRQPLIRVLVPRTTGGLVTLNAGPPERAHGRFSNAWSLKVRDDASLPVGADHVIRFGMQIERFRSTRAGVSGSYGTWIFSSLDSLERGVAEHYQLRRNLHAASTTVRGGQYAAWVGDEWHAGAGVAITMGVRADLLDIVGHAPYNAAVDSLFGRRTDQMPRTRVHLSPRVGFTWELSGTGGHQLRGGVGLFTGRPPLAWIVPSLSSFGVGVATLNCGSLRDDGGLPPGFVPDYRAAPTKCATDNGPGAPSRGEVDLLDRDLRMAQSLRASLAYDRRLPWALRATTEVLVSSHVSDFRFVNLNLQGAQGVDRFGRVLYGAIDTNGIAAPALRDTQYAEVIDLTNTSRNYTYEFSTRLERRFAAGLSALASYTYSRTRDVQSPSRVNMTGIAMWADARAISGRHESTRPGISLNDLPHRAVAALTYTAPWKRAPTSFSFYYVGESGSPFTYRMTGARGRGDLNADGSNANDPVYVPRDASSTNEIQFDGTSTAPGADNSSAAQAARVAAQQAAFERFIDGSACLRDQRGRILARNSCREPWSHTTIAAVRQTISISGRALEAGVDLFNVLNLLNRGWGQYRVAVSPALLHHVGQTTGASGTTQPVFRFDTTRAQWRTLPNESVFQLQLAVRYRF